MLRITQEEQLNTSSDMDVKPDSFGLKNKNAEMSAVPL